MKLGTEQDSKTATNNKQNNKVIAELPWTPNEGETKWSNKDSTRNTQYKQEGRKKDRPRKK